MLDFAPTVFLLREWRNRQTQGTKNPSDYGQGSAPESHIQSRQLNHRDRPIRARIDLKEIHSALRIERVAAPSLQA